MARARHRASFPGGVLLAVLAALLLPGCDGGSPPEDEAFAPLPRPSARLTPSTAQFTEGALPGTFPGDVPVYPGSRPISSLGVEEEGLIAVFRSEDSPDGIVDFFRRELEAQGWVVRIDGEGGLDAAKPDRRLRVKATAEPHRGTQIAIGHRGG